MFSKKVKNYHSIYLKSIKNMSNVDQIRNAKVKWQMIWIITLILLLTLLISYHRVKNNKKQIQTIKVPQMQLLIKNVKRQEQLLKLELLKLLEKELRKRSKRKKLRKKWKKKSIRRKRRATQFMLIVKTNLNLVLIKICWTVIMIKKLMPIKLSLSQSMTIKQNKKSMMLNNKLLKKKKLNSKNKKWSLKNLN